MSKEENKPINPKETPKLSRMNGNETGIPFGVQKQPSSEAKKAGWEAWRTRKQIADDMFKKMTKLGTLDKAIVKIDEKVDEGNLREFVDMMRIMTPKETDITTDGEALNTTVIVNTNLKKQGE
jgi:hypothetical protein